MTEITDCRSEDGITVGLIDSMLTLSYLLHERNLDSPAVREALKDLDAAPEFHFLVKLAESLNE